jgi:hypothetical protein
MDVVAVTMARVAHKLNASSPGRILALPGLGQPSRQCRELVGGDTAEKGDIGHEATGWTKPLRGRFKASIARAMQDGQKLIS